MPDLIGLCLENKVELGNAAVFSVQVSGTFSTRFLPVADKLLRDLRRAASETSQ